jgi:hypothetical protein
VLAFDGCYWIDDQVGDGEPNNSSLFSNGLWGIQNSGCARFTTRVKDKVTPASSLKKDCGSVLISMLLLPETEPSSDYSDDDGLYPHRSVSPSTEDLWQLLIATPIFVITLCKARKQTPHHPSLTMHSTKNDVDLPMNSMQFLQYALPGLYCFVVFKRLLE